MCFMKEKKTTHNRQKLIVRFCASYIFTFWGIISYNCPNTTEEKVKIFRLINNVFGMNEQLWLYTYPIQNRERSKKKTQIFFSESMRSNLFHLVRYSSINRKMKQEVN